MTEAKMPNIRSAILPSLEKFAGEFEGVFIKSQSANLEIYPFSSQFESKKINIQTIDKCIMKGSRDSLHYFLMNSSQYERKVNDR